MYLIDVHLSIEGMLRASSAEDAYYPAFGGKGYPVEAK